MFTYFTDDRDRLRRGGERQRVVVVLTSSVMAWSSVWRATASCAATGIAQVGVAGVEHAEPEHGAQIRKTHFVDQRLWRGAVGYVVQQRAIEDSSSYQSVSRFQPVQRREGVVDQRKYR